jgi:glucan endo-1,3-alpha-glucosidase
MLSSGYNSPVSIDVPAGITTVSAPMGLGSQVFSLSRGGSAVMTGTGGLKISSDCTVNNFNAFVGVVKSQ